jgi:hydrogenase expression/formation protein HypE
LRVGKLKVGKIPNEILGKIVFSKLGAEDPSVILGPNVGEDAALLPVRSGVIAFKSDPITGSVDEVGRLAVYVNANDIATKGAIPKWFQQCILLPEGSTTEDLEAICEQIDSAARELGVSIVGGHTEVTRGISRPLVIGSMIGVIRDERFLTSSGAHPGDLLYMTKSAGIEGTAILSSNRKITSKFSSGFTSRCKKLIQLINVVPECSKLSHLEGVTSIHDLTEGGLLGGAWELAEAAGSGISLDLRPVPVMKETADLCRELDLDPYRLISSGSVIFTVRKGSERSVEEALTQAGIKHTRIGKVLRQASGRFYIDLSGSKRPLIPPSADELWRGLA